MTWIESTLRSQSDPVAYWSWDQDPPNEQQLDYLQRSLLLVPPEHAEIITRIEARGPGQSPQSGGGNDRVRRIIRLSHASFSAPHNTNTGRRLNVTVLHELGHIIDFHYGVLRFMHRQRREEPYRSVLSTPYGPGNHGDGEIIADCYMIFLIQIVGRASYRYPPAPSAYQGQAAVRRFQALLESPAFACYVGPGSELRSSVQPVSLSVRLPFQRTSPYIYDGRSDSFQHRDFLQRGSFRLR